MPVACLGPGACELESPGVPGCMALLLDTQGSLAAFGVEQAQGWRWDCLSFGVLGAWAILGTVWITGGPRSSGKTTLGEPLSQRCPPQWYVVGRGTGESKPGNEEDSSL